MPIRHRATGGRVTVRPRLKGVVWEREGDELRVVYDRRSQLMVADPGGAVQRLLELLRDGGRTTNELAAATSTSTLEISEALDLLDLYGLVEDGDRRGGLSSAQRERFASNLGFFESFASLTRSREDLQRLLVDAHVLVLGTGGVSSTVIAQLSGLGVGRLTLVDRDVVEARNFARQFLFRFDDTGSPKVSRAAEWVREFDPTIAVVPVALDIAAIAQLTTLLDEHRPAVVVAGIDEPATIDAWVNTACVATRVPFVRAGMWVTEGLVWSVDPGRSACLSCPTPLDTGEELAREQAGVRLFGTAAGGNRGIGPVAGLLGSLVAFEVLRYLTRFEPPAYAGASFHIDFAAGCATRLDGPWTRDPACEVCGDARVRGGDVHEAPDPQDREHPVDQLAV
jgi:molybdopterin/thiamine biosynthesis adenylyltransferase